MFFYGYEADGLASTKVAYCVADNDGNLISEQWFDAPYCAMMHDFTITENYALFPVYPTTCDLDRLKAGGDHWHHQPELESWLGVMPRYGDVVRNRWFKGPKGVHCFHMMNAWEDGEGNIHFDQCLTRTNAFPFIREAERDPHRAVGCAGRLDALDGRYRRRTRTRWPKPSIGPPGDFPMIPAASQGRPYDHGWMLTMNPEMQGPPVMGGPVWRCSTCCCGWTWRGGPPQALGAATGHVLQRAGPCARPRKQAMKAGWSHVVDHQTGPDDFAHAVLDHRGGQCRRRAGRQDRHPQTPAPASPWLVGQRRAACGARHEQIVITGASGQYGRAATDG